LVLVLSIVLLLRKNQESEEDEDDSFWPFIYRQFGYKHEDYLTITTDYKVEVSQRLHNDYGNGKDYYRHHGQPLLILPGQENQIPSKEYLEWHNEHIYLG
jgi:hypothetical protein